MPQENVLESLSALPIPDNEIPAVMDRLLGYYFRQCSWADVKSAISKASPEINTASIKTSVPVTYKTMCLKMALVDMKVNRTPLEQALKGNGLSDKDRPALEMAATLPFFSAIPDDAQHLSPKAVQKMVQDVLKKLYSSTRRFIYFKMRFLTMCNAHSPEDFLDDFRARQIQLIYTHFPVLSGLYLINTLKADVENYGANLISYWTTDRRKEMFSENGEYKFRSESMDFHENLDSSRQTGKNPEDVFEGVLSQRTVHNMLGTMRGLELEALKYMTFSGPKSEADFLARYGQEGDLSCEDVFDRLKSEAYGERVCHHLKIPSWLYRKVQESIAKEFRSGKIPEAPEPDSVPVKPQEPVRSLFG